MHWNSARCTLTCASWLLHSHQLTLSPGVINKISKSCSKNIVKWKPLKVWAIFYTVTAQSFILYLDCLDAISVAFVSHQTETQYPVLATLSAFLRSLEHVHREKPAGEEISFIVIKLSMTVSNSYFTCATFPVKRPGLNWGIVLLLLLRAGSGFGRVRMIDVPQKC